LAFLSVCSVKAVVVTSRIGKGRIKTVIQIDHHIRAQFFGDIVYIDEHAVAVGEILYFIIREIISELNFDITPFNPTDDYDFILFECKSGNCCEDIKARILKPIRSNISRTKIELSGVTGLNEKGTANFVHEGKGNNYSNSVFVTKGLKYYLVLDNVYGGDGGHRIVFNFKTKKLVEIAEPNKALQKVLSISVIDEDTKNAVISNITVLRFDKDYNKDTLLQTQDSSISFEISDSEYYEVNASKEEYLNGKISYKVRVEDTLISKIISLKSIKVGSSFNLEKVFFIGGTPNFASGSQKALRKLYYVLRNNPNLKIQIQGHVNLPNGSIHKHSEEYYNKLSFDRAKAVYNYLIKRGIDRNRLEYKGFGYSHMIYPNASNHIQMEKNRRVEVKIIGN